MPIWDPSLQNIAVQTGTIHGYGGSSAPDGYLLCDGSAISRSTYADLFSKIGTAYGVGDGSTTFNIPDLRQRFVLGKAVAGTGSTLGGTGGAIDHPHSVSLTSGNNSASKSVSDGADTAAAHTHTHLVSGNSGTNNPPFQVANFIIKW